jgi:hypothetical protein
VAQPRHAQLGAIQGDPGARFDRVDVQPLKATFSAARKSHLLRALHPANKPGPIRPYDPT